MQVFLNLWTEVYIKKIEKKIADAKKKNSYYNIAVCNF